MTQQPPPPQPPYGGYPPNPYGGQQPYGPILPSHPQATTVLILGICGIVLCSVCAPIAWVMGNRVVREIDASNGQLGGRSEANAGRICGIVGTGLIALGLVIAVVAVIVLAAGVASTSTTSIRIG